MSEHVTVALLKDFLEAFNRHDLDSIMGYFADDCVFYMPRGAKPRSDRYVGKKEVQAGLAKRFEGIPDVHYEDVSTGSVVISVSLNGHSLALLCRGNISRCGELTYLSSLRVRSSARILSGKYLSEQQDQRNASARLCCLVSAWQAASRPPVSRRA